MIETATLFIIIGAAIKYGKLYFLIAGYNTLPKEEKEKINIVGIATLFRNVMFTMAVLLILGYFVAYEINSKTIENIFFYGTIFIGSIFLLIQSNSKKYKL